MTFICTIGIMIFIFICLINKNWASIVTYITLGVTIPLILYLMRWSSLITPIISGKFIYTFAVFYFLLIVYSFLTFNERPNKIEENEEIIILNLGKIIIPSINLLFLGLYFLENYLESGSLAPALMGIDIHTHSASFISYITAAPIIPISLNYYSFLATRKIRYLVLIILVFLTPVITRGSRMAMVSASVCFISLILFFRKDNIKNNAVRYAKYKSVEILIAIIVITFAFFLVYYTNVRMNQYGKYNMEYSDVTQYSGPQLLKFLAPYYGYFPLSFNNLNINLLWQSVQHNYVGLYSFKCLFFGIFHLHFFGVNQNADTANNLITGAAANVPTGFWTYYFDYGYLLFIPLLIAFLVCGIFLKNAKKEKSSLNRRTIYFWFSSLWFLMSFQNTLFSSTIIITGIILNYCVKLSFQVQKKQNY